MKTETKNKSPFFSVVIPVYNKGAHVRQTIDSVLGQTFSDFELIIINDASTDNSVSEIKKRTDKRIFLYNREIPGPGGYAARNLGIQKSTARWVALLDADDTWFPQHLEKMYNLINQFPDAALFSAGWIYKYQNVDQEDHFYSAFHEHGNLLLGLKDYLKHCIQGRQPVCSSVACIDRLSPVADNLFPVEQNIRRGGDKFAWLKMMCHHKEIAWSDHIGAVYEQNSENMVTKTSPPSPRLAEKKNYDLLSKELKKEEKTLLAKYMNRILKHEWFISIKLNKKYFNIRPLLYWKNDFVQSLKYTFISLLPKKLIKKILLKGNSFSDKTI